MHGAHIAAPCLTATDSFAKNAIVKKKSRKQPVWPRGCIHLIQQNFPSVSSLHSAGACEQLTLNVCTTLQFDLRLKLQHLDLHFFDLLCPDGVCAARPFLVHGRPSVDLECESLL